MPEHPPTTETPDQVLWRLWRQGQRPDVRTFLAERGPLGLREVAAVLAIDQHERWSRGERVPAEVYFSLHPGLADDSESACDIVYGEFLLREQLGEKPSLAEYQKRFPAQASQLARQVEVHRALGPTDEPPRGTPSLCGLAGPATIHTQDLPEERVYPRVQGYEILEEIGKGGMGVVYKAVQRSLRRVVALKLVTGCEPGAQALERMEREARFTAQLLHPNIVTVFDAGRTEKGAFFAMEYVPGTDLHRLVERQGPLPVARACDYIRQAALGLAHAHTHGLVHRDIKPSNLIVTRPGEGAEVVKVLDLGLARETLSAGDGTGTLTQMGAFMGTPDFVAPEQANDPRAADARSDLYALGCTFYYLLTGAPPFTGPTPLSKLMQHHFTEPDPVEKRRPEVPAEVSAVVRKLLAKNPADRYATGTDLAAALAPHCAPGPFKSAPSTNIAPPAALPAQPAGGLIRRLTGHEGWVKGVAYDPAGRRLASASLDGSVRLWEALTGRPIWQAAGHREGAFCVAFTPCGRRVVSGGKDAILRAWDAATGQLVWQGYGHGASINAVAAGLNDRVLSGGHDGVLRLWKAGSGAEAASWTAHKGPVWSAAFTPDGMQVISCGQDRLVRIWDATTALLVRDLPEQSLAVTSVAVSADGLWLLTGGMDEVVRLWELATGRERARLEGHTGKVTGVCFLPDGRGALSSGREGAVRLWELPSGRERACWTAHGQWVTGVAVCSGGTQAASGGADRTICLWEISKPSRG